MSMMISQDIINQIIEKVNIADVISEYLPVLQDGQGFKSVCPFHNDTNPSMKISPTKKIFKCFSCGAGGNVIQFVQKYEKISFVEAVQKLASKIGIEITVNSDPDYETKKKLYSILEESQAFYRFYLENSEEGQIALEYLNKRGITQEIIEYFGIGLAPKEKDYLHQALDQKNFNIIDQLESGMVKKTSSEDYLDFFRGRIMFPIYDGNNRVVGFSGRIYLPGDNAPKYINSNENLIFHKSEVLYNYSRANESSRKEQCVFVFEGFMDVIAAYKAGVNNCVATMGTALTKQHVKALNALTNKIILCFDGDNAGINATYKAAEVFSKSQIIPYAVSLPDNLDPDEYQIKYGSDALKKYLYYEQKNVYEYIYSVALKDLIKEDVVSVQRFKEKIFSFIRFSNNTIKEFYLNKLCKELDLDYSSLVGDFGENIITVKEEKQPFEEVKVKRVIKKTPLKIYRALEIIIKHSIYNKNEFTIYFCDYSEILPYSEFADYYEILKVIAEIYTINDVIEIEKLKERFFVESSEYELLVKILNNNFVDIENSIEFQQCLKVLRDYSVKSHINAKFIGALESDELIKEYLSVLKQAINIQ